MRSADQVAHPIHRRAVAFTFDDLPHWEPNIELAALEKLHERLLQCLASNGIQAVGFVNEGLLYKNGEKEKRTELLRRWLDAGQELGNHTFSHSYFYEKPLGEVQDDVMRGELITSAMMRERGMRLRYFRHPFLCTGPDLETKKAFEDFLAARGYQVAPVTVDSMEWLFADIYFNAMTSRNPRTMKSAADLLVPYMESVFAFYEQMSSRLLGYEIPQILLLHLSTLSVERLDDLARMLKGRGYRFISVEQALEDPAYSLPDRYIGPVGISWLQRWAITRGEQYCKEPPLPDFIKAFDAADQTGSAYKLSTE